MLAGSSASVRIWVPTRRVSEATWRKLRPGVDHIIQEMAEMLGPAGSSLHLTSLLPYSGVSQNKSDVKLPLKLSRRKRRWWGRGMQML